MNLTKEQLTKTSSTSLTPFEISHIQISSIKDVRCAFDNRGGLDFITGDWTLAVDPETMDDMKKLYNWRKKPENSVSLFNVFCMALYYSQKHNVKF